MSKIKFYKDSAKTQQVYPELDPEDITKFESLEDIENAFPNVSGEDTNLTLNHTVEAPMRLELAPSELEQETTTGKNLLITNSFTLTKPNSRTIQINFDTPIPEGTYTLSCKIKNKSGFTSSNGMSWALWDSSTSPATSRAAFTPIIDSTTSPYVSTKTTTGQSTHLYCYISQALDDGATITIDELMLEKGSTAAEYEPYTGGYPQPNPDFPSQVHSVSGSNPIGVCGKNLCNGINQYIFLNIAANQCGGNSGDTGLYIKTNGGKYTISTTGIQLRYRVACTKIKPSSTTQTAYNGVNKDGSSDTIIIDTQGYDYLVVNATDLSKIQIEKGSTATDFELYAGRTLPLDLPVKNVLNPDTALSYGTDFVTTFISGTRYRVQGLSTGIKIFFGNMAIPSGDYTISITLVDGSYSGGNFIIRNANNDTVGETAIGALNEKKSVSVTGKDINRLILWNTQTFDATFDIQIEPGAHANAYTPYGTTPLEYCKIGTYSDEFFKNDPSDPNYDSSLELDRWYLKKNVGKVVLDGSESWNRWGNNTFFISRLSYVRQALSDNFTYATTAQGALQLNSGEFFIHDNANNNAVIFKYTDIDDSVSAWKTWLSTHNTEVYYVLATPQYILLSDTLQTQLDDIYNWVESYPGQTNISQINNDLPFIISARAMKDLSIIDKYPTENSEHLVESGGVYEVVNDVEAVQDEHTAQIKALERASLIYNAMPKTTATGTDLTINDTAESPLKMSLGASELEQKTTTGKNLFDKYGSLNDGGGRPDTVSLNSQGQIVTTANYSEWRGRGQLIENLSTNTDYTISGTLISATGNAYRNADIQILTTSNTIIDTCSITNSVTKPYQFNLTFNTGENTSCLISFSGNDDDTTIRPTTIFDNFQFEKGGKATSYEPYTNGAAPNPEFPMDIHTISGDNEIKVRNNILNINSILSTTIGNVTITNNQNGTLTINGNSSQEIIYDTNLTTPLILKKGIKYNLDINNLINGNIFTFALKDSSNNTVIANDSNNQNVSYIPNVDKTISYIRIYIPISKALNNYVIRPILYSQEQSLPLNLPVENLLPINQIQSQTINGLTITNLDDGTIKVNGTTNATTRLDVTYSKTLKANTTYTWYNFNLRGTGANVNIQDSSSNVLSNIVLNASSGTYTSTTDTTIALMRFYIDSGQTFDNYILKVQLEEGSKANSYTPYGTPALEYCKIGSYADEFIYNTTDTSLELNKWYLKKNVGKIVLDGSETGWGDRPNYTYADRFVKDSVFPTNNRNMYCNYFRVNQITDNTYPYLTNNGTQCTINFSAKGTTTLAQFKNWLSTHNTEVYYALATPTYIPLNDTLQEQLTNIYKWAISYQEQTNISQTNNDLPFIITATAVQDINKLIATLTNAIIETGGE